MLVENLSHAAANEAYLLLMAYLREDRIVADYNKDHLKEFTKFLHDILRNPKNFRVKVESEAEEVVIEKTGDPKTLSF